MNLLNRFINTIFPEVCPLCSKGADNHATAPVCSACWEKIIPVTRSMCRICGRPLRSEHAHICGDCLKDTVPFEKMQSFGIYEGTLRIVINLFKYHGIRRLARPLSEIILKMNIPNIDIVIPVPLHVKRLKERGFNQSALLARYIAHRIGARLDLDSLMRIRLTRPQVGLSASERIRNIKGAFKVVREKFIANRDILLIDDVITTGSTMKECALALIRAGASKVYCISLARGVVE